MGIVVTFRGRQPDMAPNDIDPCPAALIERADQPLPVIAPTWRPSLHLVPRWPGGIDDLDIRET